MMLSVLCALFVAGSLATVHSYTVTIDNHYASSNCTEFTASITASAMNVAGVSLTSAGSGYLQIGPASFNIFFRFCTPALWTSRERTIQILGHGATYTHSYWSIGYKPEAYSYERAALAAGYPVLSYDLLGSGNSEQPSPTDVVQIPLNIQIAIAIVKHIRGGTLPGLNRSLGAFDKVIYVGHSMGSLVLNGVMASEPEPNEGNGQGLVDFAVLTGYAHLPIHTPTIAGGDIQIARDTLPARFAGLDEGYTVISNRSLFYGREGSYEQALLELDVATQDVVSVGDAFTLAVGVVDALNFRGHVLAINGEYDTGNCEGDRCSSLFEEITNYPVAASFEAYVIPNTGHSLNMHLSSVETYALIFDWLDRQGH
ncbi:hypothetical protein BKA62DRAFT_621740 [Auriculariales sp. MPI-PUGE-AT-0066]|nr:hypothetical protein BKA62DRAFT_621740 [Auriculariales sp. MPI-PUGE-AT-0066]